MSLTEVFSIIQGALSKHQSNHQNELLNLIAKKDDDCKKQLDEKDKQLADLLKTIDEKAAVEDAVKRQKEQHKAEIVALRSFHQVALEQKKADFDDVKEALAIAFEKQVLQLKQENRDLKSKVDRMESNALNQGESDSGIQSEHKIEIERL